MVIEVRSAFLRVGWPRLELERSEIGQLKSAAAADFCCSVFRFNIVCHHSADVAQQIKKKEITHMKVKIKKLEEHLISEVKDEVVKMAVTRKITIVMDKVFLNITAIDLTDDIIAELKRKNN